MALPDWRDETLGARTRVALWLVATVGEGGKFEKRQLRAAISGPEQVDRRMRDLRDVGWVISTYRDTEDLAPGELRLDRIGTPIWEAQHRSKGARRVSNRVRREVMERDGHRCVRCGVAAGEPYPDDPEATARMTLGHLVPHQSGGGSSAADLVTECARCNEPARHLTGAQLDSDQVWNRIRELSRDDKRRLLRWMHAGRRDLTRVEELWSQFRQLPGAERDRVLRLLAGSLTPRGTDT